MEKKGMDQFIMLLAENPEHQDKAKSFEGDMEALADYARKLGYDITADELRESSEKSRQLIKSRLQKVQDSTTSLGPGAREFYALMKLAETDEAVAGRLTELSTGTPEAVVAYGREKGFDFSEEDMQAIGKYVLEPSDELSEEELELAAGGTNLLIGELAIGLAGSAGLASGVVVGEAGGGGVASGVGTVAGFVFTFTSTMK